MSFIAVALIADVGAGRQSFNTALDQFRDFCGIELHDSFLLSLVMTESERPSLTLSAPLSFVPDAP